MKPYTLILLALPVLVFGGFDQQKTIPLLNRTQLSQNGGLSISDESNSLIKRRPNKSQTKILLSLADNWEDVFEFQLNDPVLTPSSQEVFLRVCETLPGEEYLSVLNTAIELHHKGRFEKELIFKAVIGQNQKSGFAAFNYRDPGIQSLLDSVLAIVGDSEYQIFFEEMKDGTLFDAVVLNRENSGRELPEQLPSFLGPDETALSPSGSDDFRVKESSNETLNSSGKQYEASSLIWQITLGGVIVFGLLISYKLLRRFKSN